MNKDELEDLVRDTVKETLTCLGADVDNPLEMQKDFSAMREFRQTVDTAKKVGWVTFVTTLVGGLIIALWVGLKDQIGK